MMEIIVYYEGSDSVKDWVTALLGQKCDFRKIPSSNNSIAFAQLPSYVADILYLDKPDIIISGKQDGVHERPVFAIELASCTPQFQHSIQRFSRSLASVSNGCPNVLIMPMRKQANNGATVYVRSAAADYGAVRLTDVFKVPSLVVDWPEKNGILQLNGQDTLPLLSDPNIVELGIYLRQAIGAFSQIDYLGALSRLPLTQKLIDHTRTRAYASGAPTIAKPGGGGAGGQVKLGIIKTEELIKQLVAEGRATPTSVSQIPEYFRNREECLLFYPTRITGHSGDPYVGMMTYYDMAFCRTGPTTRDRRYNLVAYCNGVAIDEVTSKMEAFNNDKCPFNIPLVPNNMLQYSYHLRDGCRKTKIKPVRIYSEIADLVAFTDGILANP
jgi:hypothetical protein